MKTTTNQSFLSKLIDKFKTSAFYDILFSESAGITTSPDTTDTMEKVNFLAKSSNTTTDEIMSIEAEFNKATSNMKKLATEVETIKQETISTLNPFAVKKEKLGQEVPKTKVKSTKSKTQEIQQKDLEK